MLLSRDVWAERLCNRSFPISFFASFRINAVIEQQSDSHKITTFNLKCIYGQGTKNRENRLKRLFKFGSDFFLFAVHRSHLVDSVFVVVFFLLTLPYSDDCQHLFGYCKFVSFSRGGCCWFKSTRLWRFSLLSSTKLSRSCFLSTRTNWTCIHWLQSNAWFESEINMVVASLCASFWVQRSNWSKYHRINVFCGFSKRWKKCK